MNPAPRPYLWVMWRSLPCVGYVVVRCVQRTPCRGYYGALVYQTEYEDYRAERSMTLE